MVRLSKEQLKAVRTLGTKATAIAKAAANPTPSPDNSLTPPSPIMSVIRGRIPDQIINRLDLEMTGALPAPEVTGVFPAPKPPAPEE